MKFKKISPQDKHKRYLERLLPLREGEEKPFEHRYYLCGNYGLVGTPSSPVTREEAERKLASGHLLSSWGYVHEKSTWDDGIRRRVGSYTKILTTPEDFDKIEQQMEKHYGKSAVTESVLNEDIAAVRQNFPSISDEDFNRIIRLDPTFHEGKDSVGTYGKWLLNLFRKGSLNNEGHVADVLNRFETEKRNLKVSDIGRFKSLEEVDAYLNDNANYKELSHRQVVRQRQKDRHNVDLGEEASLVYEDDTWEVWTPNTYAASCKLGQGTSWCTASTETDSYFNSYHEDGDLFININKKTGEKYQFHFESKSFMDANDAPIDLLEFMLHNAVLYYEVYSGMCDLDAKIAFLGGNPNGEVYYTSSEEFEKLSDVCDLIQHIEVAEGVTRIPSWEFTHCKNLLTVKLPSTLVEIGDCAFSMCRQLHSINIPDGVTDLGFNTFDYTSIESITIPDTIKVLQDNIFRHCGKLKDVHLGMGLTTIEDNAFECCSSLQSISLPNGIKSIGNYAFAHCTNLQSFSIPRSVQSLGVCPLADCRNLESVTIPNHIDGDDLGIDFSKTKLTIRESLPMRFTLTEDIAAVQKNFPDIDDATFKHIIALDPTFNPDRDSVGTYGKWLLNLFKKGNLDNEGHVTDVLKRFEQEKKNLKNKDIGQFKSLEEVDAYLNNDENYKSLSHRQEVRQRQKDRHEVDLSKEATIVGKTAEWTIWMPKTYAASCKLGEGTKWCTASTESDHYYKEYTDTGYLYIIIDNKDPYNKFQIHFESESFMDADDFEVDTLHWFLKYPDVYDIFLRMGYDEFEETLNVCKNIIDNDGLFVMSDNSGLAYYPEEVYEFVRKVIVKDGVTSLPSSAFAGCDALEEIEIPSSVTLIGNAAFYGCTALTEVELPDNIEVINVDAFQYCSQLRSIKLPAGLKRIRNGAFYGCIALKDIELPDGLTRIDSNAFYNCPSLTKLDIPDSVREIGYGAFGRSGLRDVVFPYRTIVDKNCLIQCDNLATVKCDPKYDAEWLGINSKRVTINEGVTNPPMRFILTEDIEAVRKNYPKISDEDFDRLIKLDPTYREGSNSVGTYGKWILNLFNKGKLDNEGHVFDILTRFEENKKNLKNKDIGKFKTLEELDDYLNDDDNYKSLSNRQVTRQNQNARRNADLGNEAEKVFDGSKWEVWIPKTYAASCKLGQGSSWCTATTSSDYYYNYYTRQGNLFININKLDSEDKYQFHFETGSFMDIDDRPITLTDFLSDSTNKELHDFYYPIIAKSIGVEIGGADYDLALDFNGGAFARVLDYWGENYANRDSVSADFIRQILTGDGYDLFYYDGMMTIRDSNDLPTISQSVREELKRLGLVIDDLWAIVDEEAEDDEGNEIPYADEILDAVDQATMDAVIVGTEDEAMSDIEKAMTREDGEGYVFTIDQGNLILSASPETLVDAYLEMSEGELPDILRDDSAIAADILVERWASTFRCYEPQYGWNGFSDDAFNEALADRLSEITT